MKVIGTAKEDGSGSGGVIVHLSYKEAQTLSSLQDALNGKTWCESIYQRDELKHVDLDKVFVAMRHFIIANFAINDLKNVVDQLNSIVNNENEEQCTCVESCGSVCKGSCGCKKCHDDYNDFLSVE